jgi:hypothetical protein
MHEPLAHAGRGRRAQLQVRERGLEVEPGAAHHDRPAAGAGRGVDLLVRQGGELPGRECLRDRDKREQAMLEPLLLLTARRSGEQLEPAVDLQRVRGDGHGILATLAEALRELDRHGRLADAGRPEDGDEGFHCGHDR